MFLNLIAESIVRSHKIIDIDCKLYGKIQIVVLHKRSSPVECLPEVGHRQRGVNQLTNVAIAKIINNHGRRQ